MVVKVSTVQLGGCSGCHVSLLDVGAPLFGDNIKIVHSYLLMDDVTETAEDDTDVLIIEGAVLTKEDEALLKKIGPHAKIVIAMGSCACFGGMACLGNLETPYVAVKGKESDGPQHSLNSLVCAPKAYINIDYYVPGCPPPAEVLRDAIIALVSGKRVPEITHTVCDECEREKTWTAPPIAPGGKWKTTLDEAPDPEKCLLEQGYLCLGRQTMGGCHASCTVANLPCEGCRGPIMLFRGFKKFTAEEEKEVKKCLS
jgi:F420-non-reducing hydrogenase small subunit